MTTPSTARKAGPYLGTGAQTAWPFAFKVFAEGDLKVAIADSAGVETILVLNTDYSVSLNANQETSPGGTVTYPISGSPLPAGSVLSVIGDIDYDQPLDLPSGGNFNPTAIENQLDRTTMQIQQLREELDRAAKLPQTSDETPADLVFNITRLAASADSMDTVAGSIGNVDTVAGSIGNVDTTGANIAAVVTVANDLNEPISEIDVVATNIDSVNTVGANVASVNAVASNISSVNAVATIAADVQAVADNVADVTNFSDVYYGPSAANPTLRKDGSALQSGDLYFNTATKRLRVFDGAAWVDGPVNAGTYSVERFSGTGAQTAFTLSVDPVSENNTQVYIAGVYQQKDQYSLSGTTLTFSSAPPLGANNIEVVVITALALGESSADMTRYLPAGVGAVGTTVQDKLREIVSVKDFGAIGNGSADDTSAIQAAVNALNALGGGRLYLPRGVYLSGKITVYSNIWVCGDGRSNTTIKLKNGANTDLIYSDGADALWGTNSAGGIQNFGLFDLTLDGNRANNLTAGSCLALYGEEFYFQNLTVTNARDYGIRTEWWRGDSLFGMESHYINVRIDRTGMDGWLNNGPHDSVTINLIVIDGSLNTDKTYNGLTVGPNMTGRWIGCHVWNRAASNRHQWALKLEPGGSGNEFASCHFEGAWQGNVGIFCSKNLFDSTCRFYSAWNGVNVYLGGTATFNVIKGQLDSPGIGRPDSAGIVLGSGGSDWIAQNVIDVSALDQKAGAVWFALAGEGNTITARGYSGGFPSQRTPLPTDLVDIRIRGTTPSKVNNITQHTSLTVAAGASVTWDFPYAFEGAPYVTFAPVGPSGTISSGIWVSTLSATSVTIFNSSSVATNLSVTAHRA